jgi:MFS family permease
MVSGRYHGPMTAPAPAAARPSSSVLWVIPAVYFLFVAGEFVAMTQLALSLTAAGRSALAVGVVGSTLWLGLFVASTRAHAWVERHGHANVFVYATAASTLALASLSWHDDDLARLAGVAGLGLGGGLVWVAGESWLAEAAPRHRRGFYVGMFETSVGLAMVAGPALVPLSRLAGANPLHVGTGLLVLATAASTLLWRVVPANAGLPDRPAGAAKAHWRRIALPLVALAAIGGLMESGVSGMLPSISMRLGFGVDTAAALGAVIGAGSALLQSPFGALADRVGLRRAMALAWALIVVACLGLAVWADTPQRMLWIAGFVLGGVGGAVYTLVVVELGHRLTGGGLVRAMGLLVTAYTGGTAGGPALGGWVFDRVGLPGLALALCGFGVLGSALAWRALRPQAGEERSP